MDRSEKQQSVLTDGCVSTFILMALICILCFWFLAYRMGKRHGAENWAEERDQLEQQVEYLEAEIDEKISEDNYLWRMLDQQREDREALAKSWRDEEVLRLKKLLSSYGIDPSSKPHEGADNPNPLLPEICSDK